MLDICPKNICTGCSACYNICSFDAIEMHYDKEGFLFPIVDESKCVLCNKCKLICPSKNNIENFNYINPVVIACQHLDDEVLKNSSSGGAFYAIAQYILLNKGVVIACKMDELMTPYHAIFNSINDIKPFHGSKYLQSEIGESYKQAKSYLNKGELVLFVGLPCQIAGLKSVIGEFDTTNLVTVELVCHGVGSKLFFDRYIEEVEAKNNKKINNFIFRTKKEKIGVGYTSEFVFSDGTEKFVSAVDNAYMMCYLQKLIYRESCYKCIYASIPRIADITFGDFLGVDKKTFHDTNLAKGVSLVLLNNQKAEKLFDKFNSNLQYAYRPLEEATDSNSNIYKPSFRPEARNVIFKSNEPIETICKRYCKKMWKIKFADMLGANFIEFYLRIKLNLRKFAKAMF